jgi:hypothetical protein
MATLSEAALQQMRSAVPETLHYLYSTSTRTWFGDPDSRQPVMWVDLLQWRRDGRPTTAKFSIHPSTTQEDS